MAAEIPNLVKRNGIYYFRCRIPSTLTNGRAREVKISLKTGDLTSDLLDVILKVTGKDSGIHLIISTQRPTESVITSKIKKHFPARIAFKVVSPDCFIAKVRILEQ